MLNTLKCQCFKSVRPEQVTNSQLVALVSIANTLQLNPLVPGMLYAYPEKSGGIMPMIGPDGVFKKLREHPDVVCWHEEWDSDDPATLPVWCESTIHTKQGSFKYKAFLKEWYVQTNPNWNSRPRHMLAIRALKQNARKIIHGLPLDEDERAIIIREQQGHDAESDGPRKSKAERVANAFKKKSHSEEPQDVQIISHPTSTAPLPKQTVTTNVGPDEPMLVVNLQPGEPEQSEQPGLSEEDHQGNTPVSPVENELSDRTDAVVVEPEKRDEPEIKTVDTIFPDYQALAADIAAWAAEADILDAKGNGNEYYIREWSKTPKSKGVGKVSEFFQFDGKDEKRHNAAMDRLVDTYVKAEKFMNQLRG